nr:polyadenylate-binding protein rbp47c [Quercus suber]
MTEMNGVYCSSRPMRIGAATPRKSSGYQQSQGGYASNGMSAQQADGDSTNTTYGDIVSVKIPTGKGCGFVQFANRNNAEEALQKLNGTVIGKQTVRLSWGRNPANKQFRADYGNQWSGAYYGGQLYDGYGYALPPPHDPSMYAAPFAAFEAASSLSASTPNSKAKVVVTRERGKNGKLIKALVAQMTHMLKGQLKGAVEEAEKERALKEVSEATLRDQVTALVAAKRRATEAKRSCDAEVRLAQVESVISDRDKEVADLKVAMAQSEDKFYNMGFVDAKNSSERIMLESRHYQFREGWMAAVNALDPTQNEEEDSLSMKELVGEIDSHIEVIELDILSNPTIAEGQMPQSTLSNPDPQMGTGVPPNPPEHALNPEA